MATLIVDDESNTRQALRLLLSKSGHKVILEARHGEEALKTLEQEKSRIRAIVADWEMPHMDGLTLLDRVSEKNYLDLAAYLLISSDLSQSDLEEKQKQHPRLDGWLLKPFRAAPLNQAIAAAHVHRAAQRNVLGVVAGEDFLAVAKLKDALNSRDHHWKKVLCVDTYEKLEEAVKKEAVGALLIDPKTYAHFPQDALTGFRKTPIGGALTLGCMGQEPEEVFPLRSLGHFFGVAPTTAEQATEWLVKLSKKFLNAWEVERQSLQAKGFLQAGEPKEAWACIDTLLKVDPYNSDIHALAAEIQMQQSELKRAAQSLKEALKQNPCSPRYYIKLFDLTAQSSTQERIGFARNAVRFCPGNTDMLLACAQVFRDAGASEEAVPLVEKVVLQNPKNEKAKELLLQLKR